MNMEIDPQTYVRDIEEAAREDGWTIQHLSPCASGERPWLYRMSSSIDAPKLYISAGIHGDEVSGPAAILEMLREPGFFDDFDVTLFPILNPDGLAKGIRENGNGIDLNRDYRDTKSKEIRSHIDTLKTLGPFDAAMMLHEDYEGIGSYLFELNEALPPGLGHKIVNAMGRHVSIDRRPEIDEMPARDGVISRRDLVAKFGPIEERPDWAEAIYLSVHHTKVSYTTETPKPFPLGQRVHAQIAGAKALMETLLIARS